MANEDRPLRSIFLNTDYRVRLARGGFAAIRVDRSLPPALATMLPAPDKIWAFVTAWNPHSVVQETQINRKHQRELLAALRREPSCSLVRAGVGAADHPYWREPSLFVVGVPLGVLDQLLRPFEQHAIVCGVGAGPAELRWLD